MKDTRFQAPPAFSADQGISRAERHIVTRTSSSAGDDQDSKKVQRIGAPLGAWGHTLLTSSRIHILDPVYSIHRTFMSVGIAVNSAKTGVYGFGGRIAQR
jgi:hypothetical protein